MYIRKLYITIHLPSRYILSRTCLEEKLPQWVALNNHLFLELTGKVARLEATASLGPVDLCQVILNRVTISE